jgi:hypothetical protein
MVLLTWLTSLAVPAGASTVVALPASQGTENIDPPLYQAQFSSGLGSVSNSSDGTAVGAMVFDLSFIPQGTSITSATFTMSVGGSLAIHGGGNPYMLVYDYVGTSAIVSLADFGLPTTYLGEFSGLPKFAGPGSLDVVQTFDVSNLVQSLVTSGTRYVGFEFQAGSDSGVILPGNTTQPSLTINSPSTLTALTVPEPPGALLLALGAAGVVLFALRTRLFALYHAMRAGKNSAINSW